MFAIAILLALAAILPDTALAQLSQPVKLSWLGGKAPELPAGVSWGVPLPEGKVSPKHHYALTDGKGRALPIQSWPMAYWPDGSVKWVGLSTVVEGETDGDLFLQPQKKPAKNALKPGIQVTQNEKAVIVRTGKVTCEIPKSGTELIAGLSMDGREISAGGRLICLAQNGPDREVGEQPARERYVGNVEKVTIEQDGPVRAVIRVEGKHQSESGQRNWLPFTVRLYFYAGQQSVRLVHTFIYDGDQEKDFIRGLGLEFDVPLDEQLYNRHVRFSGEDGRLWDEPCQPLTGRVPFIVDGEDLYPRQLTGERIAERDSLEELPQFLVDHWASWNDFKLQQLNADGFTVEKRTNGASTWIGAGYGKRSGGMAFVGDVSGGLALCVKDFWQSYPSALEARDVRTEMAKLKAWLWSPEAEAMDMRHYDTLAWGHNLRASYEDVQPGFSYATGVARTSEITLYADTAVPSYETLSAFSKQTDQPPLLTAAPEYIHAIPVFGIWSLPDKSTAGKRWLEDQLDNSFAYYQLEVEQRHWYGFWHYGDVRHAYDPQRHVWRYDIGGFAWDNTELMPNMWLWYSFLRSGRADIFRMAEAMTRHNGEVDCYHLGKFNGLGSRHNVVHWGDGAKEVRISQAALGRFFYYLTTDERTGDLMRATVETSNEAIGKLDPLRLILEKSEYPTHARVGPDWLALVGNWMTEWERTGDARYRDRIMAGVNSLAKMPYGFFSGKNAAFGYNQETYELHRLAEDHIGSAHLSVLMGGPEVGFELSHLLQNPTWDKLWLQFCKLYGAPVEDIEKDFGRKASLGEQGPWYARLPAYYALTTGEQSYAERAWDAFLNSGNRVYNTEYNMEKFDGIQTLQPVYEVNGVSTNTTAQWCLNAIELLQMVGDKLPEENPKFHYRKGEMLYQDYFFRDLDNWVVETPSSPNSTVQAERGKLTIDVDNGATVWLKEKLSGNLLIEYRRTVVMKDGPNDRLSDLNQFWMASDPAQENLFTRSGVFEEYHQLRQYYAGIGGNTNSTTRFRKYQGGGERTLIFDLQDEGHLLQPNRTYLIQIVVYNGKTELYVDGKPYFSYEDTAPLTEGYFGFRTVKSHQEIQGFRVYRLK
ncbi:MAG TPA: DUF6250 domain-containing protein [Calditrichia bacterium]|nr:DUF6250 domain-containing protein [Calditrichia bacterium]